MDPFLDLVRLLRPRAMLWGRTEGVGRWSLGFRKREDLLFAWVERGTCQLVRSGFAPVHLQPEDFILIRTVTPFTLTTDPTTQPAESETLHATTNDPNFKLGSGKDNLVVLRGGKFVFDTANEDLLTDLLPSLVHVAAGESLSWRVRSLLQMNEAESKHPGPGSEFIMSHLVELILVEILRGQAQQLEPHHTGLLAGLADPVTACAIKAMHEHIARAWTVASLAKFCGVSRSSFATRFHSTMGLGPIEYLHHWRMALAKDGLRSGSRGVGDIGLAIGFGSSSAFTTAFTRTTGLSPKRFSDLAQKDKTT
jgi:AraC-like DNA-binding protein